MIQFLFGKHININEQVNRGFDFGVLNLVFENRETKFIQLNASYSDYEIPEQS